MATTDPDIIGALSKPATWGPDIADVRVIHTHGSIVFLVGDAVYKLKRAVDLGFLDYSTLDRRGAMCRAEVALNRRLAPDIYVGVVPITARGDGVEIGGDGPVLEWAVHMKRLPDDASWAAMVERGDLGVRHAQVVATRLAQFHREARRSPEIAAWGAFEPMAAACRDNIAALRSSPTVVAELVARLDDATEHALQDCRGLIERRAAAGVPCEFHGDLRLEHVYDLGRDPGGAARPEDLRIIDCIEFSDALRHGDPVADVAFLVMDLRMHGAWSLAGALVDAWVEASGDADARTLMPLMCSYRSAVRAKVRAIQATDDGLSVDEREHARSLARGHLVHACAELASPESRPCLVLVGGLPGTGKSHLAADLEQRAGLQWIRADAVRKELAGLDPNASGRDTIEGGIYTHAWNDRTYGECLARADAIIERGGRAIVDASFKEERRRLQFIDCARRLGVPVRMLCCTASPDAIRRRLAERTDDPSDADWTIYEHAMRTWDPYGTATEAVVTEIDTEGPHAQTVELALAAMRADGLYGARG